MNWPSLSDETVRNQLMLAGVGVLGGAAVLGGAMWVIRSQAKHGDMLRVRLIHDVDPQTRSLIASYLPAVNRIAASGVDVRVRFGPKAGGGKSDELEIPASALSETPPVPEKASVGYASSHSGVRPMTTHVLDVFGAALMDAYGAAQTDLDLPASRQSSEEDDDLENDDDLVESVLAEGADDDEIDVDDDEDEPDVDQFGRDVPSKHQLAIIRILPLLSDKKLEKIAKHRRRSKFIRRAASRELERRAGGGEALDEEAPVTSEMVTWYTQEVSVPPPASFAPYRRGMHRRPPARPAPVAPRPIPRPAPPVGLRSVVPPRPVAQVPFRAPVAPAVSVTKIRPLAYPGVRPANVQRSPTGAWRTETGPKGATRVYGPQGHLREVVGPKGRTATFAPGGRRLGADEDFGAVRARNMSRAPTGAWATETGPRGGTRVYGPQGHLREVIRPGGQTVSFTPGGRRLGADESAPSLLDAWMAHPVQSVLAGAAVFTAGVFLSERVKDASSSLTSSLPSLPRFSRGK